MAYNKRWGGQRRCKNVCEGGIRVSGCYQNVYGLPRAVMLPCVILVDFMFLVWRETREKEAEAMSICLPT